MKIYKILKNGYFGGIEIIPDNRKGIPLYYTRTAPPEISEGMYAVWVGNKWRLTDTAPVKDTVVVSEQVGNIDISSNVDIVIDGNIQVATISNVEITSNSNTASTTPSV